MAAPNARAVAARRLTHAERFRHLATVGLSWAALRKGEMRPSIALPPLIAFIANIV